MTQPRARQRQAGVSLISMMVGLMISLLVIASMLVFYRSIIEVTNNASREARRDGQVAAALLAAQMDLQSAGFGVPASSAPGTLSTNVFIGGNGKEIVWRNKSDPGAAAYQCSGLLIVDAGTTQGLYTLPAQTPCASASTATWAANAGQLIAGSAAFFVPTRKDGTAYTGNDAEKGALSLQGGSVFALGTARECLPYMQQDFAATPMLPSPQVTLAQASNAGNVLFSVCLSNLAGAN